jgi:hypothetical protein
VSMGGRQASASRVQPAVVVLCGRRGSDLPSVCARLEGDVHQTGGGACTPPCPAVAACSVRYGLLSLVFRRHENKFYVLF